MITKTVSVPVAIEDVFARAEKSAREYFADRSERPEQGTIEISGERYILVRAASMSVDFADLIASLYSDGPADEARRIAADFLFDLAHATGKADAKHFHERAGATDPLEKLSFGPTHFAHRGWASVAIDPSSRPVDNENYLLMYEHPYSFEADAWLRRGRHADMPVCAMNAGYSSGWCEESFGIPLIATEITCRAAGGEACRFVMAPPWRMEEHLARQGVSSPAAGGHVQVPEFFQRRRLEEKLQRKQRHVDALTARVAAQEEELARLRAELGARPAG
jgi:predicted hydrocarbon binding protein